MTAIILKVYKGEEEETFLLLLSLLRAHGGVKAETGPIIY